MVLMSCRVTRDKAEGQVLFQEVVMLTLIISPMSHPRAGQAKADPQPDGHKYLSQHLCVYSSVKEQ